MSEQIQRNTYRIQGLQVPELEESIRELRQELGALRGVVDAAVDAIKRVDNDVIAILDALGVERQA